MLSDEALANKVRDHVLTVVRSKSLMDRFQGSDKFESGKYEDLVEDALFEELGDSFDVEGVMIKARRQVPVTCNRFGEATTSSSATMDLAFRLGDHSDAVLVVELKAHPLRNIFQSADIAKKLIASDVRMPVTFANGHEKSHVAIVAISALQKTLIKTAAQIDREALSQVCYYGHSLLEREICMPSGQGEALGFSQYHRPNRVFVASLVVFGTCVRMSNIIEVCEHPSIEQLTVAANEGHAKSQYEIAMRYKDGIGVERNLDLAKRYRACAYAHSAHQYRNANRYLKANDFKSAFAYFKVAADEGHVEAQMTVAKRFVDRKFECPEYENVDELQRFATKYYKMAANQGHKEGQYCTGWCYEHGAGVEQNLDVAFHWYEAAADQGHIKAKRSIKRLLFN